MTIPQTEKLISILKTNGVNYFKSHDVEIRMEAVESPTSTVRLDPAIVPRGTSPAAGATQPPSPAAAPPREMKIPHHLNEVVNMLKMSDEQLVDRMFPEAPQPTETTE